MMMRSLRTSTVAIGMAAALFVAPAESQAIFHWFNRCCNGGGLFAPTAAAVPVATPTYTAYADPCGCQPQQAAYVPQTCYRTQYVNMPTTVYRPVTIADRCTGCPVTTMRPMIAYLPQARQVPYVSYRIVYSNPAVAYSGLNTVGYAAPAGCSGCGSATPTYSPAYTPAPATQPYYPGVISGSSAVGGPAASGPAASGPAQTFQNGAATGATDENRLKPIPDLEINKDSRRDPPSAPRLIAPDDSRTTYRPLRRAVHVEAPNASAFIPASRVQPSAAKTQTGKSAWRQSSR
ncbi:MAG TPA: hypothetical protein VMV69_08245 [Pirellulales bacterium]|nr:hypothetical protein [Pirellulales bacterium]